MSAVTPQAKSPAPGTDAQEITIVSHSNLFYWWPVWLLAFILGLLTWIGGHVMAVVPNDNFEVKTDWIVKNGDATEVREGILLSTGKDAKHTAHLPRGADNQPEVVKLHVTTKKTFGVLFVFVLLVVILITNVPLRGMWSLVVIILIVLISIILGLADLWEPILRQLSYLDIRINEAGYFVLAGGLFLMWILTFVFFDRQMYIKFEPRQMKVCTEIGGGEKAYDTQGMTVEKERSDLFRHWILGLGSGDLVVKTSGAQAHQFDLHNVLFVSKKVAQIESMLRKQSVIDTK